MIGNGGFGISSGLSTGLPRCLEGLGRAQLQQQGMSWVVEILQNSGCAYFK